MFLCSCTVHRKITYFKNIPDSIGQTPMVIKGSEYLDPIIQPNDILQVSVQTIDPRTNEQINASVTSTTGATTVSTGPSSGASAAPGSVITGFLVDKNGFIELPLVGRIKVGGLNTTEARDKIHENVSLYYKSPVVNVRFASFEVTVLGEVTRPATYNIPNEKASILDAIGRAGDLAITGKRENVLLVREENGVKKAIRFNLNSSDIFASPYFYLKQRDMIYVEPNKAKRNSATTDTSKDRYISLTSGALSILIAIVTYLKIK
jgi:polysaccharide export outer membrane protein